MEETDETLVLDFCGHCNDLLRVCAPQCVQGTDHRRTDAESAVLALLGQ